MVALHKKYAPILHFNEGEMFFPMQVDTLLSYSSLHLKDRDEPLLSQGNVTPERLARQVQSPEMYLRSVKEGPLSGREVVHEWGEGALEMVLRWAQESTTQWTESLASKAYRWFSPNTSAAAGLFWWNDVVSSAVQGALESVSSDKLPRLTLPLETRNDAIERYQTAVKKSPEYTYYYRYLRDGDYLCLQYWFFYSYNDWGQGFSGFNDHEGDWEGMFLFFRTDEQGNPQEPPAYISYANHESRMTKAWNSPDVQRVGNHPQGYVGAGSHATYPQAITYDLLKVGDLLDFATGDGITIEHDQWANCINLAEVSWLGTFQGSWGTRFWLSTTQAKTILQLALAATPLSGLIGLTVKPREIELPGVSAPRGPVGMHRPQNSSPVAWAGISD